MRFGLVRNQIVKDFINFPDWQEFEQSILQDDEVSSISRSIVFRILASWLFGMQRRLGKVFGLQPPFGISRDADYNWRIAILGGPSFRRCTDFIFRGKKAAYLFDPTPPWVTHEQISSFVKNAGISVLFVPHPSFCDQLGPILDGCDVHFISEAGDPDGYKANLPKTIDVIVYGRRLFSLHDAIMEGLAEEIVYQHERLETREDLIEAIGRSKISINFPRSVTETNVSVEMLTMRYFQAIASKALILGSCPPLLKELFGYDPGIEVDLEDPCGQIRDILNRYVEYVPLVEKNYQTFVDGHTYWHRWLAMKEILKNHN
jgi:hypothetical protein